MGKERLLLMLILCLALTDMAMGQARRYSTGCLFDANEYGKVLELPAPMARARGTGRGIYAQPESHSLRQYCPKVGDQGQYGSCVAWACGYYARSILAARRKGITDRNLIDGEAFSPGFLYDYVRYNFRGYYRGDNPECEEGIHTQHALKALCANGAQKIRNYPESCQTSDDVPMLVAKNYSENPFRISEFGRIEHRDILGGIKGHLAIGNPIVLIINYCESFGYAGEYWSGHCYETELNQIEYSHAVVVTAYDDTKFGGAFEIVNSWGREWGNEGYTWIRYRDLDKIFLGAYALADTLPLPDYDIGEDSFRATIEMKDLEARSISLTYNQQLGYYQVDQPLLSHAAFKLFLSSTADIYLYILSSDLNRNDQLVFPWPSGKAYLPARDRLPFPNGKEGLRLDANPGKDYLCFIFSRKPLNPYAQVLDLLRTGAGDFVSQVRRVLADRLVPFEEITFRDDGEIDFIAPIKERELVAVFVEIKHE